MDSKELCEVGSFTTPGELKSEVGQGDMGTYHMPGLVLGDEHAAIKKKWHRSTGNRLVIVLNRLSIGLTKDFFT